MSEFGPGGRLVPIRISDCDAEMEEAHICLRERAGSKPIRAFLEIARETVAAEAAAPPASG